MINICHTCLLMNNCPIPQALRDQAGSAPKLCDFHQMDYEHCENVDHNMMSLRILDDIFNEHPEERVGPAFIVARSIAKMVK